MIGLFKFGLNKYFIMDRIVGLISIAEWIRFRSVVEWVSRGKVVLSELRYIEVIVIIIAISYIWVDVLWLIYIRV